MLITLKVVHEGEIRRFRHVPASFAGISSSIAHGFDLDPSSLTIRYCDADRDLCTLTPRTVSDALTFLDDDENLLRLFVASKSPPVPSLLRSPLHVGVVCDGCECDPLLGTRFKCRDCENFDLCDLCFLSADPEIADHLARHEFLEIADQDDDFPWVLADDD